MTHILELIKQFGLNDTEAKLYKAALELGEASVQDMARIAGVKRTSIYYMLDDLVSKGILVSLKRNKKVRYTATPPSDLLKAFRSRLVDLEDSIQTIEDHRKTFFRRPAVYFLEGPSGFKQVWNMIFESHPKEYRIMTEGLNFLDFVKEKYIVEEIINTKKKLNVVSRQIIPDSPYARKIISKDGSENRQSRLLPARTPVPFTEIIAPKMVAYISPRFNNVIFVVENEVFAESRRVVFDLLWDTLE
jgi:sugar-specific transcriptional regulator TrmB